MSSIFRRDDNYVEQPKRNTYDMSFQNNLTTRFGALNVCFCKPVLPGESYRITPTFGLRYLPMVYPVQTRMKASINFFYVRNRNLWKDFPDFIGKTKEGLTPPYIHITENNRKMFETSQLGDYMGIPTKIYDKTYRYTNLDFTSGQITWEDGLLNVNQGLEQDTVWYNNAWTNFKVGSKFTEYTHLGISSTSDYTNNQVVYCTELLYKDRSVFNANPTEILWNDLPNSSFNYKLCVINPAGECVYVSDVKSVPNNATGDYVVDYGKIDFQEEWFEGSGSRTASVLIVLLPQLIYMSQAYPYPTLRTGVLLTSSMDVSEMELSELPWRSDGNSNGIPLSALPFRAYESIYNCFYRNAENNPLLINGVPEYNKWLRTQEGGADTNIYPIYYHNWEDDFLTTALPSPQQGNAPLVGLTGTPTLTIAHDDGTTTQMQLTVEEDGTVSGATAQIGDTPTQNALIDAVSYGITINDFRNVNAFQRWLENNIRRGYKYKDQIKTHYGVSVRYDELDMPEFIGGVSESVMVNQISQTTPTETSPLGDMAGQASAVGQGRSIEHYCDEHGFIIGILCVKPVANYSQLLPKFFNITDSFDYYFPEFGHIGMQPITYAEVTPLQAFKEGKLNDVFGYQRAWYDLIASTDEVHGLFRSDFRNFLINRAFDGTPQLGAEFTVMNPDEINDVFAYQGNTDKILGQIYFDASKKTPIPLYGIPRLE